jgi:hypothetical protein
MKHAIALATASVAASPALAHGGLHMHPHESEMWIALAFTTALAGGAIYLWGRK